MRTPASLGFVVLVITAVIMLDGAQAQPPFQDDFSGNLEASWVYDLPTDTGYAANGIWKSTNDAGAALSFYLQKYVSGSCVVVVTADGLHYTAFLDENYTDGITASDDVGNHGYTLDLSLENATRGTLTVTLPSGAATKEVALQYPDTR